MSVTLCGVTPVSKISDLCWQFCHYACAVCKVTHTAAVLCVNPAHTLTWIPSLLQWTWNSYHHVWFIISASRAIYVVLVHRPDGLCIHGWTWNQVLNKWPAVLSGNTPACICLLWLNQHSKNTFQWWWGILRVIFWGFVPKPPWFLKECCACSHYFALLR